MRRALILLCVAVGCSWALVRAYSVEPKTAAWSGWTRPTPHPNDYISQTITCNFDSLKYVELFAGDTCSGEAYNLSVLTLPGGYQVAGGAGNAVRPHSWVRFDNLTVTAPESIVKGRRYEFKFTRAGSDSINYYYYNFFGEEDPYPYGYMLVEGNIVFHSALAMRVYGAMDTVESSLFGVSVSLFPLSDGLFSLISASWFSVVT